MPFQIETYKNCFRYILKNNAALTVCKYCNSSSMCLLLQVDTSAANSTSEGLMWLRLVQSARDKEEQNLEAYVKNGQLFYRSLRRIEKDEELLVWYGKDLIDLLLLSSSRAPVKGKGEPQLHRLDFSNQTNLELSP